MFCIRTASTLETSAQAAVGDLLRQIESADCASEPKYAMLQLNAAYDCTAITAALRQHWPNATLHIATSCLGSMTDLGLCMHSSAGASLFCILDTQGDYGSCATDAGDDPFAAGCRALRIALQRADRIGEIPDLIWLSATPGVEEAVIAGIQSIVGTAVPIVGGSAADNSISGQWSVADGSHSSAHGLLLSVFFPGVRTASAFHSGYTPTQHKAVITSGSERTIRELAGRPAAAVYAEWTGQKIPQPASGNSQILMQSAFYPLGREMQTLAGTPVYLLAHPETVAAQGSMTLFANVTVGEEWTLMTGDADALLKRPLLVAASACKAGEIQESDLSGMIFVYCAGCMLSVRDRIAEAQSTISRHFPDVPFITAFTFGEQGPVLQGCNQHGNLMISAVVFAKE